MNRAQHEKLQKLSLLLAPLSALYFVGAFIRLLCYRLGLLRSHHLNATVISVGNLTVGGTGKTPVTIDLARRLIMQGYRPAILSRGYKRKSGRPVVVVSDGSNILSEPADCGDEPFMMARAVPRAVVIVGSDRKKTGELAISKYGCDVLLLDDGFQHLKVSRQIDVVLYDYNDDPETAKLLPGGRLREPLSALGRAHYVVITKVPDVACPVRMAAIRNTIGKYAPHAAITACQFVPDGVQRIYTRQNVAITTKLNGARVVAFCGIARPETFFQQLSRLGAEPVASSTFPDHHWFSENELANLRRQFQEHDADLLITTEKDAVRLPEDFINSLPVAQMRQETEWQGEIPLPPELVGTLEPQLVPAGR
ncbi:MAG: tetraacyldisaccharide 4'-kinase [Candidatus Obscuribacterales bacterium]|nr:tetraacyldisaccharide 4'-kinase [Candidatus Obscuribacterales bacterium]